MVATHPYRLDVFALTVSDAVSCAGGWLFDQARAGWKVSVLVRDRGDFLPLRILGVAPMSLDWTFDALQCRRQTRGLAVAMGCCEADPWMREIVQDGLARRAAEVTVWGDSSTASFKRHLHASQYRPSQAALAFKSHALGGATSCDTETFHTSAVPPRFAEPLAAAADFVL